MDCTQQKKQAALEVRRKSWHAKQALLTPEQKNAISMARREKRKAQRKHSNHLQQEKRQALSPEEKEVINANRRKQKQELPPEQRSAENAKRREKRQAKISQIDTNFSLKIDDMIVDESFHDFENHPERAVLLYHLNSGHHKFWEVDKLLNSHLDPVTHSEVIERLKAEIQDEILTKDETQQLLCRFAQNQGRHFQSEFDDQANWQSLKGLPASVDAHHLVCGSCGIKSVHGKQGRNCTVVPLDELPSVMCLSEEQAQEHLKLEAKGPILLPVDEEGNVCAFHPWKLKSIYKSSTLNKMFHLHPEFVHVSTNPSTGLSQELTVFCCSCSEWFSKHKKSPALTPPKNSIASGIDFGDYTRLGLSQPSLVEMIVISRVRHFHNIVKITNNHSTNARSDFTKNQLRAHSINFRQDAPVIASLALMFACQSTDDKAKALKSLFKRVLSIQLVGPDHKVDILTQKVKMQQILCVKAHIIWQWLSILQITNSSYQNDPPLSETCTFAEFKSVIDQSKHFVFEEAIQVTNKTDLIGDLVLGDDVANVRSGILTESDACEIACNTKDSTSMNMSCSFVADACPAQRVLDESLKEKSTMAKHITEIACAFNVELPNPSPGDGDESMWKSTREEDPVNEFQDMGELLIGAFPTVFVLGKTHDCRSLLDAQQMEHLLLQHTHAAANNRQLLFYLFDCKSRHHIIQNMAAKVRKDPMAFQEYATLLRSDNFKTMVKEAALDPYSPQASKVLKLVLPVLSFGSKHTPVAHSAGDTTSMARGIAMSRRRGPNTTMITVTPDDINSPTSLRFALKSMDNCSFPAAVDDTFFDKLKEGASILQNGNVSLPLNYCQRYQLAANNPIAVALEFRTMMENIISILIGCPLDCQPGTNSTQKRTWYFKSKAQNSPHHKGIFGHVTAFFGCVETQARGALHFHIVLWGGITPNLLEKAASFPQLCSEIQNALDTMYVAQIPRSVHMKGMLVQKMKETPEGRASLPTFAKIYPSMKHIPSPKMQETWKKELFHTMLRTGIHKHSFTCKTPPAGKTRCRGARPAGDAAATLPVLLEVPENLDSAAQQKQLHKIVPTKSSSPIPPAPDSASRNIQDFPVPPLSKNLVVWELKRPLLQPLAPVPEHLQRAFQSFVMKMSEVENPDSLCQQVDDALSNVDTVDIAELLLLAKEFCVREIGLCLGENTNLKDEDSQTNITNWMKQLSPVQVVKLYEDLNKQIVNQNGLVTETNSILSLATGASTNAILIGNTQQATAALFYVLPYLTKNKFVLEACLTALENAQADVEKFPSIADDTGTDKRTVQHMFTRVLNELSRSVEISDTQVALDLLNTGSEITSDSYKFFGADYCVNHFLHHTQPAPPFHNICMNSMEDGDSDMPDTISQIAAADFHPQENFPSTEANCSFGPAPFYRVCHGDSSVPQFVPVQYPIHWWFRGKELAMLTQMEYAATIDIKPLHSVDSSQADCSTNSSLDDHHKGGRPKRKMFQFHPSHPLFESHCQVLRAKQHTLIFHAHPPKNPGPPPLPPDDDAFPHEVQEFEAALQTWTKAADKFAQFHEILFLPHTEQFGDHAETPQELNWQTFCNKIEKMEQSHLLIHKLRLDAMFTFVHGFCSDSRKRILFSNFRHRNTTRWSDEELRENQQIFAAIGANKRCFSNDHDSNDPVSQNLTIEHFSSAKVKQFRTDINFCRHQMKAVHHLFSVPLDPSAPFFSHKLSNDPISLQNILHCNPDADSSLTLEIARRIKLAAFHRNQQVTTTNVLNTGPPVTQWKTTQDLQKMVFSFLLHRQLSPSQHKIICRIEEHFWKIHKHKSCDPHSITNPIFSLAGKSPHLLLTGDPGSGKSYVIETICELAALMNVGTIATCSYNGIAAVNIDGTTICTLFKINDRSSSGRHWKLHDDGVLELKQKLCSDSLSGVIIDEASTIDTRIIALLHHRLQQAMDNFDEPFGGLPIFLIGDFNQLGPVLKTFIPKDMMVWATRTVHRAKHVQEHTRRKSSSPHSASPHATKSKIATPTKCSLSTFRKRLNPKQTKRTPENSNKKMENAANRFKPGSLPHTGCSLLSKFEHFHLKEQQRASGDPEHNKFVQKLSRGEQIALSDILKYKHLTKQDVEECPDQWKFAPVLVSTNKEWTNISRLKARPWAKDNCTHVFKWKVKIGKEANRPEIQQAQSIRQQNAFFWQFFVAGAPCNLNKNINGELALVNGTPIKAHSLTFATEEELHRVQNLLQARDAPSFGTEIEIEQPLSVNFVVIPSLDGKPVSALRSAQMDMLRTITMPMSSDTSGDIVIPVTANMCQTDSSDWSKYTYNTNGMLTPVATAQVLEPFPFDLAFAMTVHKAQGRTIERVVLDLTEHKNHYTCMEFAAVFVAMSRVRSREHIRLLKHAKIGERFNPVSSYQYLTKLKADHNSLAFLHGFNHEKEALESIRVLRGKSHHSGVVWDPTRALNHTSTDHSQCNGTNHS